MPRVSHTESKDTGDVGRTDRPLAQCSDDTQAKQRVKSLIHKERGSGSPTEDGEKNKMTYELGCKRVCDQTVLLVIDAIPEWIHGVWEIPDTLCPSCHKGECHQNFPNGKYDGCLPKRVEKARQHNEAIANGRRPKTESVVVKVLELEQEQQTTPRPTRHAAEPDPIKTSPFATPQSPGVGAFAPQEEPQMEIDTSDKDSHEAIARKWHTEAWTWHQNYLSCKEQLDKMAAQVYELVLENDQLKAAAVQSRAAAHAEQQRILDLEERISVDRTASVERAEHLEGILAQRNAELKTLQNILKQQEEEKEKGDPNSEVAKRLRETIEEYQALSVRCENAEQDFDDILMRCEQLEEFITDNELKIPSMTPRKRAQRTSGTSPEPAALPLPVEDTAQAVSMLRAELEELRAQLVESKEAKSERPEELRTSSSSPSGSSRSDSESDDYVDQDDYLLIKDSGLRSGGTSAMSVQNKKEKKKDVFLRKQPGNYCPRLKLLGSQDYEEYVAWRTKYDSWIADACTGSRSYAIGTKIMRYVEDAHVTWLETPQNLRHTILPELIETERGWVIKGLNTHEDTETYLALTRSIMQNVPDPALVWAHEEARKVGRNAAAVDALFYVLCKVQPAPDTGPMSVGIKPGEEAKFLTTRVGVDRRLIDRHLEKYERIMNRLLREEKLTDTDDHSEYYEAIKATWQDGWGYNRYFTASMIEWFNKNNPRYTKGGRLTRAYFLEYFTQLHLLVKQHFAKELQPSEKEVLDEIKKKMQNKKERREKVAMLGKKQEEPKVQKEKTINKNNTGDVSERKFPEFQIFIKGLPSSTTKNDVNVMLNNYGGAFKPVTIYLPVNKETGEVRGYGFAEYKTEAEVKDVVNKLEGKAKIRGSNVTVSKVDKNYKKKKPAGNKNYKKARAAKKQEPLPQTGPDGGPATTDATQ